MSAQTVQADFRADKELSCAPAIINFTDASQGNPIAWKWDFGNGSTSTRQNPSTVYTTPGRYTVSLIVTRDSIRFDTLVRQQFIHIARNPAVNFTASQTSGCSPVRLQFTDQTVTDSATRISKWEWDFGDGTTAEGPNPSHIYRAEGSYAVALKVTDNLGCTFFELRPRYITVTGGIAPAFTPSEPSFCGAPVAVTFANQSTGPGTLSYKWSFGDGGTSTAANPTHTYTRNDSFDVQLVVTSSAGCFDTLTQEKAVKIQTFTTRFFLEGNACPGVRAQLVNNSTPTPTAAAWLFPDGTTSNEINPSKVFPAAGTYSIRLINSYGNCADTITSDITVAAPPAIDFSTTDTARCAPPLAVRFQNNTTAASFAWEFGDNNFSTNPSPTHTYAANGSYSVTLTATSAEGCVATLTKPGYINIRQATVQLRQPAARGCLPYLYTPELDINSLDQPVTYQWDFGDGGSASGANPSYTYRNQGTYNVSVTITTAGGCTVTQNFPAAVRVGTKPAAGFTGAPLEVCASTPVVFTNTSTGADEYLWEFGDGGTSSLFEPRYNFTDTGFMDVRLLAFSSGCADTLERRRYVYVQPSISAFGYLPNCNNPLQYTFSDQSKGAQSWQWNFGDGTTFTGQNPPAHLFPGQGTFQVQLTTSNGVCTHTVTRTITIGRRRLNFSTNRTVGCKPAVFNFSPSDADLGGIARLVWQFTSNGVTREVISAPVGGEVVLDSAGTYTMRMIAIDTFGCRVDSVTRQNYLRVNGPSADFSSLNAQTCLNSTVDFDDRSRTDGVNNLVSWEWNFGTSGELQTFTAPPFRYRYDTLGAFNVRLKVTDAAGCSDVVTKQLFARTSTIKADFSGTEQTCPGGPASFSNQTNANVYTSVWQFGDGNTAAVNNPTHSYRDTGYYSVTLKVTNPSGCTDSLTKTRYVYAGRPKADFETRNYLTYCIPSDIKFTNQSTYTTSSVWDLGQGISRLKDPTAYFTQRGNYAVTLVATSPGGCTDTAVRTMTVKAPEEGMVNYVKRRECRPITVDFVAFDSMQARFVWDFGDGTVADTTTNKITHTYTDFGSYIPQVVLYDPVGCIVAVTGRDTLQSVGVQARFAVNSNLFCDQGTLIISDSTTSNDNRVDYRWNFGDGSAVSTQQQPQHFYSRPGSYRLVLNTVTNSGCADSSVALIKVSETPVIGIAGDSAFCALERRSYNSILQNPNSDSLRWQWVLPNGQPTNVRNPGLQIFPDSGTFRIEAIATNPDGCADTAARFIRVHPLPGVLSPPPVTIKAGDQVLLPVRYTGSLRRYFWSPAQTLSCDNCPQPVATPRFDTRYAVSVTDSNNCRATGEVQVNVQCSGANVFAPNTFSPNGDGKNDVFFLRGTGLERVRLLRVFNRWGEVVFERRECPVNDPGVGWDGRYKGGRPQPDVYVFQAEVYCSTGELIRWEGNVALIQ